MHGAEDFLILTKDGDGLMKDTDELTAPGFGFGFGGMGESDGVAPTTEGQAGSGSVAKLGELRLLLSSSISSA